jgi:hypothetical protein
VLVLGILYLPRVGLNGVFFFMIGPLLLGYETYD